MILVLLVGAWRTIRRTLLLWILSLAALILVTSAFWPAFRDHASLSGGVSPDLVEALGLGDLGTPAGFLWGNLYALLVPLLMAVAGCSLLSSLTAHQEDSGQYEMVLTQPVSRRAVLGSRIAVVTVAMVVLGAALFGVQLVCDQIWDVNVAVSRLLATLALCTLLAVAAVGITAAAAGFTGRPSVPLSAGIGLTVAGYVVSALFPLHEGWTNAQYVAPWNWALGGEPLTSPAEWWRYLSLIGLALGLSIVALLAFDRRDVHVA